MNGSMCFSETGMNLFEFPAIFHINLYEYVWFELHNLNKQPR